MKFPPKHLLEQHRKLREVLAIARKDRSDVERRVRVASKALGEFEKQYGNVDFMQVKMEEWIACQPEFEARRQDPEFQTWREEFLQTMKEHRYGK